MKKFFFVFLFFSFFLNFVGGAKLRFESDTPNVVAGCPHKVRIMLDTQGEMTTAMDLKLKLYGVGTSYVFDGQGGLFKQYILPQYGQQGQMSTLYTLLSTMSRWGINGSGQIGTLIFESESSGLVQLFFDMIPGKDVRDSNVMVVNQGHVYDVLTDASPLILPIVQGVCDSGARKYTVALEKEKQLAFVVSSGKIPLLKNLHYVSQYPLKEFLDRLQFFIVRNIDIILYVLIICILFFLGFNFYKLKVLVKKIFKKK